MKLATFVLGPALLLITGLQAQADEQQITIPSERMFYALITPDSTASLQITCPSTLIDNDDWWHDCGKFFALTSEKRTPGPNALKDAWRKANDEVARLVLDKDMTYANWSGGSLDLRDSIRVRLMSRIHTVLRANKVYETVSSMTAPDDTVSAVLEQLQDSIRSNNAALFHYCPGVAGNIAVNTDSPLYNNLPEPAQDLKFVQRMKKIGDEFTKRLAADRNLDADARQGILDELLKEVLDDLLKEKQVLKNTQ